MESEASTGTFKANAFSVGPVKTFPIGRLVEPKSLIRYLDTQHVRETGLPLCPNSYVKIREKRTGLDKTIRALVMKEDYNSIPLSRKQRINVHLDRS